MKRRSQYLCALLLFFVWSMSAKTFAADRPNIVFILSDDHRWDQLGCAGHPIVKTPHIDQMAADGVRFKNMFVTTSICAASRATIFTGMYERGHRYTFGTVPIANEFISNSYPTKLKAAGYRTGFVGKFGVSVEGGAGSMFDYFRPLNRSPYFKTQSDGTQRHVTQIAGDLALEFLEAQEAGTPFCLSISFNAPHAEDGDKQNHYPVPKSVAEIYDDIKVPSARLSDPEIFAAHPEFLRRSMQRERFHWRWDTPDKFTKNMRGYWGMISGVDHVVGRVRKKLSELGLDKNTIVIFTGDNGYYLGQRGFAGKWSHYEESLRVPLVVVDPRLADKQQGTVRDEVVLNVDLAPTMLSAAGVETPDTYQGIALTDLISGREITSWRDDFFCEHLFHIPGRIPKYEGVRGTEWTYARYIEQEPPYEFLHNLRDDPDQLTNFAKNPAYADQLTKMRDRCDELMNELGGEYSREKFKLRRDVQQQSPAKPQPAKKPAAKPAKPSERPNVVLIISDDQSWTDYSFIGHAAIKTPSIDQLAKESATFLRGYVPTALCRPSLATMITGLYPRQHGITGNDPAPNHPLPPGGNYQTLRNQLISKIDTLDTIPKLLGDAGYLSHQSGKWWEGNFARGGFTHGMTHGDPKRGGRHGDEGLKIGRTGMDPIEEFIDHSLSEEKPFFLWYAPFLPHTPHNPPQRLLEKYQQEGRPLAMAKYYAMCEWFDESCGDLLEIIDDKGLRKKTLVIYVTDNGWIQRTPSVEVPMGWRSQYAPRSKQSPNEGGVRTPIMVRWPGHVRQGKKQALVSSIDIAPTILKACGVEVPAAMSGIDLLLPANNKGSARAGVLFGESYAHDIADLENPRETLLYRWVISGNMKLIRTYNGTVGRYKSTHNFANKATQLYDLMSDPHENDNLAEENPQLVKELTEILNDHWDTSGK